MTEVVDKLIFALDADLAPAKARYREFEAATAATAAKTSKIWETTSQSIQRNVGSNRTFKDAAASASVFSAALGDTDKAASNTAARFAELNGVTKTMHGSASEATRQFRALFGEFSSGNVARTPGTLAMIATRVFGISGATLAWGVALTAIPLGFAAAAIAAEQSLARIRTAILLTARASGLTVSGAGAIAAQIAANGSFSERGAGAFVAQMIGTSVPGAAIAQAGRAAGNYGLATGASSDDTAKLIQSIFADPSKSAAELNRQMNLLSYAQTEEVTRLQKSGEYARASRIVMDAFDQRTREAANAASLFSRALDGATRAAGGLIGFMARTVGAGLTPQQRLDDLRARRASEVGEFTAHGNRPLSDAARRILAPLDAEIARRQQLIDADNKAAAAAERSFNANRAVGDAMAEVNANTGAFKRHLDDLQSRLNGLALASRLAGETGSKYASAIEAQRAATARALDLEKKRTPEALAAQRAADAMAVALAPSSQQARIGAELAARRSHEANLANPAMTSGQADAIYQADLTAAKAAGIRANDRLGERQARMLAAMKAEADAAEEVARAYELGTAGVARARAVGEAHVAFIRQEISDEKSYAAALMRRAFAQEAANVAQKAASDANANLGLARIVAAGGNPAATMAITARNEALAATQQARDNAVTAEQIELANRLLESITKENLVRAQQSALIQANTALFSKQNEITAIRQKFTAFGAGGNSDDLRRLEAAQGAFEQLWRLGFDPAIEENRALYQTMMGLAVQASDLSDKFQKVTNEARDLASGVTGPLKQLLTHGGSPLDTAGQIGQNILDTLVQTNLIDPLQKKLEGLFGGLLGVGAPGSSPARPSYTWVMNPSFGGGGAGNPFGGLGGGGSLPFSVLGGTTGGLGGSGISQAAKGVSGGGFFSSIFDFFAGLFDEGGTIGPGQWGIKSGKPEIIQGGMHGVSIVPLAAPVLAAALQRVTSGGSSGSRGRDSGSRSGNITLHMNFNGPNVDKKSVLHARAQMEATLTRIVNRGGRSN